MLDLLRGFSKGWVAKILIGLLVLSFGVWGISGSLFFGAQTTVAQVGDTSIEALDFRFAYDNQLNVLSRSLGRRLSRQQADALGTRQNVLDQLVAGAVLDENTRKMGLGVSNEVVGLDIANDPTFQDLSGNFSNAMLQQSLRQAGMTENEFIETRKQVSRRNQFVQSTAAAVSVPQAYLDAFSSYQSEKRIFQYVTLGRELVNEVPEPDEAQASAYYDENKAQYQAPEYRKVVILKLEPSDLAKPDAITDEELQAAYDARKDNLLRPERREIEQLVLNSGTADQVKQQLADGVAFETIVEEQGKTLADINLGALVVEGLPDENIAKAAFAAELNKPTDVIEGNFGPVVVRIIKIEEESTTPFEELKEQLRTQMAQQRAIEDVFANFDAVEDERGAGETVLATAQKLGLTSRTIEAMDLSGLDKDGNQITDVPQLAALLRETFSAAPGDDTQAIELGESGFLWFNVLEIIPERQKPLEEVKDDVIQAWKSDAMDNQIEAVAKTIIERVDGGSDFNAVLGETLPENSLGQKVVFSTTEALARNGQTETFPAPAVASGFSTAEGKTSSVQLENNQLMIVRVSKVEDGSSSDLEETATENLQNALSQDVIVQMVEDLRSRESVVINESAIDLAFNPYGGMQHGGY